MANRTFTVGVELADRYHGSAIRLEEIPEKLKTVDIIISSTGSPNYVITKKQVKPTMRSRKNRPLFFIDIAVPRDIDPRINKISNAYVYDIDDLKNIVETNINQREQETVKAGRFVEEALVSFKKWLEGLSVVPTIKAINDKMTAIVDMEFEKTVTHLNHLAPEDVESIRRMTRAIASRTIHDPILFLRNTGDHRDDSLYVNVARQLFNLDISEQK